MGSTIKRIQYRYDSRGNRVGMTDPDGGRFTYAYDAVNRMSHMINPQGERTTYGYDAAGRRTVKKLANGTRTSFAYDATGNLTKLANLKSDGTTISSFEYGYDSVGTRTSVVEADGSRVTWSYDSTYQLTGEHRTGSNAYRNTFAYDPAGNRTLKNEDGARTTYVYDAASQMTRAVDASGTTTYAYDGNGNREVVIKPNGDRTTTLWDFENRPKVVQQPSGERSTMTYAPDGLRVKLEEATETKKFVWDEQNYLAETDENDDTQVVYTNEPRVYGNLVSQRRATDSHWYHFDALGSTRELTDPSQAVTDTRLYDAWGVPLSSSGATVIPFEFNGKLGYYRDSEATNLYVRSRVYSPEAARWISIDPVAFSILLPIFGNVNFFAYVRNYPIGSVDPSGLVASEESPCECCCCVDDADILGPQRWTDIVPGELTGVGPLPRWGHRFLVRANMSHVKGPTGKCTIEWLECSDRATGLTSRHNVDHTKWHDSYELFKDAEGKTTVDDWVKYERGEDPFDDLGCRSFDIDARDTPLTLRTSSKELRIVIRISSAPDCPCHNDDVTLRFLQSLTASGAGVPDDFIDREERPGETWIGRELFGGFESTDTFVKGCGPLPT